VCVCVCGVVLNCFVLTSLCASYLGALSLSLSLSLRADNIPGDVEKIRYVCSNDTMCACDLHDICVGLNRVRAPRRSVCDRRFCGGSVRFWFVSLQFRPPYALAFLALSLSLFSLSRSLSLSPLVSENERTNVVQPPTKDPVFQPDPKYFDIPDDGMSGLVLFVQAFALKAEGQKKDRLKLWGYAEIDLSNRVRPCICMYVCMCVCVCVEGEA
jgi:hypothetical protein